MRAQRLLHLTQTLEQEALRLVKLTQAHEHETEHLLNDVIKEKKKKDACQRLRRRRGPPAWSFTLNVSVGGACSELNTPRIVYS